MAAEQRTAATPSPWWAELREAEAEHAALVAIAEAGRTAKLSILFARAVKARLDLNREIADLEAQLAD